MATLSILALYNYDPTVFDGLTVPTNDDEEPLFDKETLISIICAQNAELSLLYTQPSTVKELIRLWSKSSQYSWKTLAETMFLEYNPIWNKDAHILETETLTHNEGVSGTSENKVSAYNESKYTNRAKDETTASKNSSDSRTTEHTEGGNIGVTSSQSLVLEQRNVALFNLYDQISDDFRSRFCIMVY